MTGKIGFAILTTKTSLSVSVCFSLYVCMFPKKDHIFVRIEFKILLIVDDIYLKNWLKVDTDLISTSKNQIKSLIISSAPKCR